MTENERLADAVKKWRGDLSAQKAADILGIPVRTLNGIEQGRGFRYAQLLYLVMEEGEMRDLRIALERVAEQYPSPKALK
jgi:sugar (pentulose or hexulose) kinase